MLETSRVVQPDYRMFVVARTYFLGLLQFRMHERLLYICYDQFPRNNGFAPSAPVAGWGGN